MKIKRNHTTPPGAEQALQMKAARRRAALTAAGCATYALGQRHGQAGIVCLCCGLGSSSPEDIKERYCGFCKEHHTGWTDAPAPAVDRQVYKEQGIVNVLVQTGYGHNTQEPFVEMVIHAADWSSQMSPDMARELGHNLLGAADAAESDAFLMGFLRDFVGVNEPAALAGVLCQFRDYREKLKGGNVDD